jgi:hypothetical protein
MNYSPLFGFYRSMPKYIYLDKYKSIDKIKSIFEIYLTKEKIQMYDNDYDLFIIYK